MQIDCVCCKNELSDWFEAKWKMYGSQIPFGASHAPSFLLLQFEFVIRLLLLVLCEHIAALVSRTGWDPSTMVDVLIGTYRLLRKGWKCWRDFGQFWEHVLFDADDVYFIQMLIFNIEIVLALRRFYLFNLFECVCYFFRFDTLFQATRFEYLAMYAQKSLVIACERQRQTNEMCVAITTCHNLLLNQYDFSNVNYFQFGWISLCCRRYECLVLFQNRFAILWMRHLN